MNKLQELRAQLVDMRQRAWVDVVIKCDDLSALLEVAETMENRHYEDDECPLCFVVALNDGDPETPEAVEWPHHKDCPLAELTEEEP